MEAPIPPIRAHQSRPHPSRPRPKDKEISAIYFRLADFLIVQHLISEIDIEDLTPAEVALSEKTNAIISKIRASKERKDNQNEQRRIPRIR